MFGLPKQDLEFMANVTFRDMESLSSKRVFLTGFTGFFGSWILNFFNYCAQEGIGVPEISLLSRNPIELMKNNSNFRHLKIDWIKGDIRKFNYPKGHFNLVIHGATPTAYETYSGISNEEKFSTILDGTKNVLNFAKVRDVESFIYVSSGAVFGGNFENGEAKLTETQPISTHHLDSKFTLGNAKRAAESLVSIYRELNLNSVVNILRLFTFAGPHMPVNLHYAFGNFLNNVIRNEPILLTSDGLDTRSYMYMSDALCWLIRSMCLTENVEFPLHLGSERPVSILSLAEIVSEISGLPINFQVESHSKSPAPSFYVPSTALTRSKLQTEEWTSLNVAVEKTLHFMRTFN